MSGSTMAKQRLPSPPASLNGDYQSGIDQLLQHNGVTQYTPEQYTALDGGYAHSSQSTRYGSPAGSNWLPDQNHQEHQHGAYQHGGGAGLGIGYNWYENPVDVHHQGGPYHTRPPGGSRYPDPRYTAGTPPTPTTSEFSGPEIRSTRSGRTLAPSGSNRSQRAAQDKSRVVGSPKIRKTKQTKGDRPKIPKLDAPLSELTKDYAHIAVRNMEDWVNRSSEVRNKEVEKRNGYVTRPMNSFMLYRSAYADRTKLWCSQNNHQVVSLVTGQSWPLEPPQIREQFNEYARIERDNHQRAHPGYKFSPTKSQNSSRKRKETPEDSDDEDPSESNDPDVDWTPSGDRRPRTKSSKRMGREAGYPVNSTFGNKIAQGLFTSVPGYNRSSYQATNPGKPLPAVMSEVDMYGQYYQQTIHPSLTGPYIEDVRIRKTAVPIMQPGSAQPLIGLPGAHHYELLDHDSLGGQIPAAEPQVDPSLLGYDSEYAHQPNGFITEQQFQEFNNDVIFGNVSQTYEQPSGDNPFHQEQSTWQFGETQTKDADEEFSRWMEENNDR